MKNESKHEELINKIRAAYAKSSREQKDVLEDLFGKEFLQPKDITERVKTLEDAISLLGNDNQAVIDYFVLCNKNISKSILAFAKLRVIAEALNEGWKPTFDEEENRYYPWFYIFTKEEYDSLSEENKRKCLIVGRSFIFLNTGEDISYVDASYASSGTGSDFGYRLALKTRELAEYCGKQFIDIWGDYLFC